jgi:hypothetical protein
MMNYEDTDVGMLVQASMQVGGNRLAPLIGSVAAEMIRIGVAKY